MDSLSIGVAGCGYWGTRHIENLQRIPEVRISAVIDIDAAAAARAGALADAPSFRTVEEAIASTEVEALIVATPATSHREVALKALDRGLSVLVEKPPCSRSREVRELGVAASRAGCVLGFGFIERYNPAVEAALDLVARGSIGEVVRVESQRFGEAPQRVLDVGVVLDLAIHDLDIAARLLGGGVWLVDAEASVGPSLVEDRACIRLWRGKAEAVVYAGWGEGPGRRVLSVKGSAGSLHVDFRERSLIHLSDGGSCLFRFRNESLEAELREFLGCARRVEPTRVSVEDGCNAVLLCEAALGSAASHRVAEVELA
jgi:predicted dehydrogenase